MTTSYPDPSQLRGNVSSYNQDELLRKFLAAHNIKYTVDGDDCGNTSRTYTIVMSPRYLDNTERKVVEFCEKNGIKYRFYATEDMHHYEFEQGVFIDGGKEHVIDMHQIDLRELRRRGQEMREDLDLVEALEQEELALQPPPPELPPTTRYKKFKRKARNLWRGLAAYHPKTLAAQKAALEDKEKELRDCERRIEGARHDLLILSGIITEDEE